LFDIGFLSLSIACGSEIILRRDLQYFPSPWALLMQSYEQKKRPARKKRSVKGFVKERGFLLRIRKTKVGGFGYHIVAAKFVVE
jgi:hypothetical protein